jgi:hypothetical protein
VTRRQWLPFQLTERAPAVRLPFRAKEEPGIALLAVEAVGEVEQVGDEEHLHPGVDQWLHDLPGDLRPLALVRTRRRSR